MVLREEGPGEGRRGVGGRRRRVRADGKGKGGQGRRDKWWVRVEQGRGEK